MSLVLEIAIAAGLLGYGIGRMTAKQGQIVVFVDVQEEETENFVLVGAEGNEEEIEDERLDRTVLSLTPSLPPPPPPPAPPVLIVEPNALVFKKKGVKEVKSGDDMIAELRLRIGRRRNVMASQVVVSQAVNSQVTESVWK